MFITDLCKTLKTCETCVPVLSPGQKQFPLCHKILNVFYYSVLSYFYVIFDFTAEY